MTPPARCRWSIPYIIPFDPGDQKMLRRRSRVSFALALIALVGGIVCIMAGEWPPGLILVFAAVAGIMSARQLRGWMRQPNLDDPNT